MENVALSHVQAVQVVEQLREAIDDEFVDYDEERIPAKRILELLEEAIEMVGGMEDPADVHED